MDRKTEANGNDAEARRRFLATCGKFAVATPPVVALMLADAQRNYAMASTSGNNGFGNGGGDGVPGNSGFNSSPNAAQKAADEER